MGKIYTLIEKKKIKNMLIFTGTALGFIPGLISGFLVTFGPWTAVHR
jgi:hypothetical protein